jgi:alpha-glucosidase
MRWGHGAIPLTLLFAFACASSTDGNDGTGRADATARDASADAGGLDAGGPVALVEALGPGIVRVFASADARAEMLPSYAFENPSPPVTDDPIPALREQPEFRLESADRTRIMLDVEDGTSLYGLGEAPGPTERTGATTTLWNTDAYGYRANAQSLYQSHPWVLGVRADGTSFGMLVDSTYRMRIIVRDPVEVEVEGPAPPVVWFEGDSPQDVLRKLASLTGTMPMPPKWALGFHQSRYSYFPESKVREIAAEFRARDIPCDVIWFDIDYMDGFKIFTFDESHFPDPAGLNADLLADGFHNVWMINPGIASLPGGGYDIYDAALDGDYIVRSETGDPVIQRVWPGETVFPDYTRPDVRAWWASLYDPFMAQGITGVWNDMNEPAVFDHVSRTLPESSRHGGEPALGGPGNHARFHNVYGMLMVRASRDGIAAARPDRRPFVLSRANFIGGHRYAATWTGDNTAEWWDLDMSVAMILSLGLSGQPFSGPDIGGFIGYGESKLFRRWMGVGALLPFSRAHTATDNPPKEPWSFGETVETTSRRALENRYALMPHLYTVFEEAHRTGLPVARPVFFVDPADPSLRAEDDAFLIGDSVLVVPNLHPVGTPNLALPAGAWREFTLHGEGDRSVPELRARPGRIIPVGPKMEFVDELPLDPLTLVVNLGEGDEATGWLYEDAGDGYGHESGAFRRTRYRARRTEAGVVVDVAERTGDLGAPTRTVRVRVLTEAGPVEAEGPAGSPITVTLD